MQIVLAFLILSSSVMATTLDPNSRLGRLAMCMGYYGEFTDHFRELQRFINAGESQVDTKGSFFKLLFSEEKANVDLAIATGTATMQAKNLRPLKYNIEYLLSLFHSFSRRVLDSDIDTSKNRNLHELYNYIHRLMRSSNPTDKTEALKMWDVWFARAVEVFDSNPKELDFILMERFSFGLSIDYSRSAFAALSDGSDQSIAMTKVIERVILLGEKISNSAGESYASRFASRIFGGVLNRLLQIVDNHLYDFLTAEAKGEDAKDRFEALKKFLSLYGGKIEKMANLYEKTKKTASFWVAGRIVRGFGETRTSEVINNLKPSRYSDDIRKWFDTVARFKKAMFEGEFWGISDGVLHTVDHPEGETLLESIKRIPSKDFKHRVREGLSRSDGVDFEELDLKYYENKPLLQSHLAFLLKGAPLQLTDKSARIGKHLAKSIKVALRYTRDFEKRFGTRPAYYESIKEILENLIELTNKGGLLGKSSKVRIFAFIEGLVMGCTEYKHEMSLFHNEGFFDFISRNKGPLEKLLSSKRFRKLLLGKGLFSKRTTVMVGKIDVMINRLKKLDTQNAAVKARVPFYIDNLNWLRQQLPR